MNTKQQLRKRLQQQRQALSPTAWRDRSAQICAHLAQLPQFQQAQTVLGYWSFRQEPDLSTLYRQSKRWGLPRCVGKMLVWHEWPAQHPLVTGAYGLQEPAAHWPILTAQTVDLLLVPAVGCDRAGYRLGYGGGYYDRLLSDRAWSQVSAIGITFEFACVDELPREPWDQPLDGICTEAGFFAV